MYDVQEMPSVSTRGKSGFGFAPLEPSNAETRDSVAQYLAEIEKFKLLSPAEEIALGQQIRANNDADAVEKLIVPYLRLVPAIARRFLKRTRMPIGDLIGEGNLELIRAATLFDPARGRFSTYAIECITSYLTNMTLTQSLTVRIPRDKRVLKGKAVRAKEKLVAQGKTASLSAIAQEIGVTEKEASDALALETVVVSIGPLADEHEISEETLPDCHTLSPEDTLWVHEELSLLEQELNALYEAIVALPGITERNIEIFRCRYGLNASTEKMTLKEIGGQFGITCERVRQITGEIWSKLRGQGYAADEDWIKQSLWRIGELEKLTGVLVVFN